MKTTRGNPRYELGSFHRADMKVVLSASVGDSACESILLISCVAIPDCFDRLEHKSGVLRLIAALCNRAA